VYEHVFDKKEIKIMKKKLFAILLAVSVCALTACSESSDAQTPGTEAAAATEHEHDWVAQTTTVHHDAEGMYEKYQDGDETKRRWVETTEAWDETVTTGYVCSICGAEQE
jgi:Ni/Co efflux regulator RcnB